MSHFRRFTQHPVHYGTNPIVTLCVTYGEETYSVARPPLQVPRRGARADARAWLARLGCRQRESVLLLVRHGPNLSGWGAT